MNNATRRTTASRRWSRVVVAVATGVLTLSTVLRFTLLRTNLVLTDAESYALLAAYLAFVAWVAGETVGAVDLVVGA